MKLTRPSGLSLLTVALLVLLPALAVLQYRWVGQVSDAERERMQHNLRNAASQFRDAFDLEVGRAILGLQVGPITARDGASEQYTDRYETWVDTSEHPQLVSSIFLVDAADAQLRLRRFDPATHAFEPIAWPGALERWRLDFERQLQDFNTGVPIDRRGAFAEEESLIVSPLRNLIGGGGGGARPTSITPVFGFTIIQLDVRYLQEQILPALARRFFIHQDGDSYRVAVVSVSSPSRVLYRSDLNAPVDASHADATEIFFGLRGAGGPRFLLGRGGGSAGMRLGQAQGPNDERRLPPAEPRPRRDEELGRWRLLVQHASGSLETAVTSARRRNLGLSFGILLLLSVSVGLLAAASRRAHRLAEQQMEFVAGVTHELRTPVAVIRSAAENLSHGVVGNSDRVKRYGAMIESEARRLGEMIESVLQYAGLESGAGLGATAEVQPAEIVDAAIGTALAAAGGPGALTVQRDIASDLPNVIGDAAALRSAIQNLIANAVKYGGADRWVGVRAEHVSGRRPEICITVSDHGAGIPPADLPHIFEPFYRGSDAVAGQVHGNGLGLSLVRRIAIAHGGRVAVSSKPNAGTTFTLTLPVAPPQSRASVTSGASVTAHTAHT
ncbi:MAG TPA: HAMP domain-containing sensor histidine kinase [Vicinamibacterales bacterium]|nr:HAMP domain-containing sensor histidine kinase [Vicinamibacterales bacterium]